jgi:aspartyl-tRNA(Asn)/glutamyl-tRNA(Gln) amidotransferase subunit A
MLRDAEATGDGLDAPLTEIARALRRGETSSRALVQAAIARHAARGDRLNAYRTFAPDFALARADEADRAIAAGRDLGPLQGLPVSVKDLFAVTGLPTYAGTPRRLPPKWEQEGPVVGRLQQQLGVIVGKSHTVEFALGGLGTNRHYGSPYNPWDARDQRISGGSSSGAGVSLLEGSALVAIGSDTTGSVRMPASFTGTVGLMVSHGRWSTEGIVPVAPILDAPGLLTRTVADLVPAFLALDGPPAEAWERAAALGDRALAGSRIGVPRTLLWDDCSPGIAEGVEAALAEIEAAGARLVPFDLPEPAAVFDLFQSGHLSTAAVYGMIRSEFPEWWDTLDENVRARLERYGAGLPAHEYVRRLRTIEAWMRTADAKLAEVDAIAFPTVSVTPARVEDLATADAYRTHNIAASRNCAVTALFGVTGVTLPVALDAVGMPVGLQLAARHGSDAPLLALALACERILGTRAQRLGEPPLRAERASRPQ